MNIWAQATVENQWGTLAVMVSIVVLVIGLWAVFRFKKGRTSD